MHKVILNDVIDIISGGTPKTDIERYWNGEIGWLSVVDFNNDNRWVYCSEKCITLEGMNNSSTKLLNLGDIIISARGTVGALAQIGKPMCFNQSCFGLRGKQGIITNDYLYYALKNYIANMRMCAQGSVFETINLLSFKLMDITIHDKIEEQSKISYILGLLDNKIELNNKINTELEEIAKDLYDYWFIQFDFPDKDKRPYKSSGGKMVYNDVLKREIPEGWVVESITDNKLTKILKPGIKQFDGQKIYLPTAAIENDCIINKSNLITYYNREGRANMEPVSYSVWFAKMKNTKKVLYFGDYSSQRIKQTILSTGMLGLKCVEYALEYVWNFVNNDSFEAIKNKLSHGATQEGVNNDDLSYFPMIIPTMETLRDYSVLIKDLYKQKYFNEIENERLTEIRDFLLPMLMNGQVSVS